MARLKFDGIKAEVLKIFGTPDNTSIDARIEQWIKMSYWQLCLGWHHYELDVEDRTRTLGRGSAILELPTNAYILFGVGLHDKDDNDFVSWMANRDPRSIQSRFTATENQPVDYARLGNKIILNCQADKNYPLALWYYSLPEEPDFETPNGSALSEIWDDILILHAAVKGLRRLWEQHVAAPFLQDLQDLLSMVPQVPLVAQELPDRPSMSLAEQTIGGGQG
jgi:hypothetical protein